MSNAIIFDLDGTLIQTEQLYDEAKDRFHRLMVAEVPGVTVPESEDLMTAIDIANTSKGWTRHRFPGSMAETYIALCAKHGAAVDSMVIAQCCAIGYTVFSRLAEPVPGAGEVLARLSLTHRLYLYTLGDQGVQAKRIADFAHSRLFTDIGIPAQKDAATLRQFLDLHRLDPATTWYVGDSPKSDIQPAIECGLRPILVQVKTWAYNNAPITGEYLTAKDLPEVFNLIHAGERVTA